MKSILKSLLARTPYRILRRGRTNRFQAVESTIEGLARRGFDPSIVIDGGANIGDFSRAMLEMFPAAKVYAIEPQPGCAAALDALAESSSGRLTCFKAALGAPEDDGTTLMLAGDAGSTSTGAYIVPDGDDAEAGKVAVSCRTIDALLEDRIERNDRIFLKLDLQGYEMQALKGAERTLAASDAVLTEVSFYRQAYEPPIEALVAFLSDHGFELHDIASISARPRDNRAKQGDFLFVRRTAALAADTALELTMDVPGPSGEARLRRVIIVSPYFPPSTLAGVHRARHLARHLPSHGWDPVIVHVDERHYPERADPDLARLLPADLKQVRTDALPYRVTHRFGIGDIGLRGYRYLQQAVIDAAERYDAKAVMITGSPFYPLLMAGEIKRRTGLPVLLDLQDPWVQEGPLPPLSRPKARAVRELALRLEPRAVRHADFITSVSETQNAEMAARYPFVDPARMAAIPIGGDPGDFDALRAAPPASATHVLDDAMVNFSYVGAFLPRAGPLTAALMAGLALLRDRQPTLAQRIRLNFVGTSNQPDVGAAPLVLPIAARASVADLVRETPQRVPFLEALALLAKSDGLLMIGSDEPHYTASKIYPNLMAQRPYLSLFHAASSAHAILTEAAGGVTFAFETLDQLDALHAPIADALARIAEHPEGFTPAKAAAYAPFTADAVSARYAAIFDRLAR